jgi:hypothetical protein
MANREKINDYAQQIINHIHDNTDMITHRIKYGDPILFQPIGRLTINTSVSKGYRKKIIEIRRKFLGLEYKEYEHKGEK